MKTANILAMNLGIFTTLFLISSTIAVAQDDLARKLSELRSAAPDRYESIIDGITQTSLETSEIAKAILAGVKAIPDASRQQKMVAGWSEWTATDVHDVTRPYQIYLPPSVAGGDTPMAVVVHMHGAVGKPEFGVGKGSPSATGYAGFIWPQLADAEKLVIVCPVGRDECSWWTDNGIAHVDAVIRDVRRMIDVPEESIFAAGFSDGGSGCYYRAMVAPDPFAGFIALNGHPSVASSASGKQIYLPNMAMSTTFAAMTQQDSLYPSKSVMPHILTALQFDADILTVSYPKMNHQPSYFKDQTSAILSFLKNTKRTRRDRIRWYASDSSTGRVGPLELKEFVAADKADKTDDFNVMSTPGRIRIGIQFAQGSNIASNVVTPSAAASAGVRGDDALIMFDGQPIAGSRALRGLLAKKQYGDSFTCTVDRAGSKIKLTGKFPAFVSKPIYVRDNPTGYAECQFIQSGSPLIELKSSNVSRIRIWLPEKFASLNEIDINHNGKLIKSSVVRLSAKELLGKFAESGSSFTASRAFVEVQSSTH